jgi:hypothetical protein
MFTAITLTLVASFQSVVEAHFAKWDSNQDGALSRKEVDMLVSDHRIKGQEAAAIAVINQIHNREPKVRQLSLQGLVSRSSEVQKRFSYLSKVIRRASEVVFEPGDPKIRQIHQGRMGNCFVVAPIGAMAYHFPDALLKLYTRTESGEFLASFPKRKVKLQGPTDAEIATAGLTEGGGFWVPLLEKTVATVLSADKNLDDDAVNDTIAKGGSSRPVLRLFTGEEATKRDLKDADGAAVLTRVAGAAGQKKVLGIAYTGSKPKPPGVTPHHAYAILGFESGKVVMWNPHGDSFKPKGPEGLQFGYAKQNGIFRLPPDEAVKVFGLCVTAETTLLVR